MLKSFLLTCFVLFVTILNISCTTDDNGDNEPNIVGFSLLSDVSGHWVGKNETPFGIYDWFSFDFRPISSSHIHSIYEGASNQNIINSFFVADFEGKKQIMARNGGWLGNQYRATYFVLDIVEISENSRYYRLVDAVGGVKRSYMELRFENDTLYFDAFKDNSGTLDEPIPHMSFKGTNFNPNFAQTATNLFNFPQKTPEIDLNNKFINLIDPDSALFLEENQDPFPKSTHGHVSDLTINFNKNNATQQDALLLYISTEPIISEEGNMNFEAINTKVVRTINIQASENNYTTTYLHPDNYYITAFSDRDNNFYPSSGDFTNISKMFIVTPNSNLSTTIDIDVLVN